MKINLPLRWRLTFWYSLIVLLSLATFAVFAYYWVYNELYTNLDESLQKISHTLNNIIEESATEPIDTKSKELFAQMLMNSADKFEVFRKEEKSRFIGPLKPVLSKQPKEKRDMVWSAIFKHILLNPENYFIQIADTNNQIIWKSRNLNTYDLPLDNSYMLKAVNPNKPAPQKIFYDNINVKDTDLRLLVNKYKYAVISVAYTVQDVQLTLRSLFSALLLAVPFILIASFAGGMFLSKMSLRPVDQITKTATEIRAKNLNRRIEVPQTNDEISRLAETLNEMIQRLEQSFEQVKRFTSDASHELRTPLTILRGEMEIALKKERTNSQYIETIGSSLEEVMRLSKVVESLLELSRADAGQVTIYTKMDDLSSLILDIVEDMEILAEDKDIKLKADIQNGIFCDIDAPRIHQAILNVIDNAVKYTNPGGQVNLSLKDRNHYFEIKISDSGIGVSEEELGYIFDRFYRVDKARAAGTKGTGLGLSIVKWIIEAHNGKIFVESQPGKGTNFNIMIPKQQK